MEIGREGEREKEKEGKKRKREEAKYRQFNIERRKLDERKERKIETLIYQRMNYWFINEKWMRNSSQSIICSSKTEKIIHFFHRCWLHSAAESPQHLLFHSKLHRVMGSEIIIIKNISLRHLLSMWTYHLSQYITLCIIHPSIWKSSSSPNPCSSTMILTPYYYQSIKWRDRERKRERRERGRKRGRERKTRKKLHHSWG